MKPFAFLLLLFLSSAAFGQASLSQVTKEFFSSDHTPEVRCLEDVQTSSVEGIGGRVIPISSISMEQAQELFREIAARPEIPFRYPQEGCNARAHAMCRIMDDRGVISGKIFAHGKLSVTTDRSPLGYVTWDYHVATTVKVRKNGQEELMVFDPALFNRPVTVAEWSAIQTPVFGTRVDRIYNTSRFVYKPANAYEQLFNYRESDLADSKLTMERCLERQQRWDREH